MSLIDGLLHRLRVLVRGERYASEQEREVEFHLELETMAQQSPGAGDAVDLLDAPDMRTAARRAFGNVTYYREESRRVSALHLLDRVRQDLHYAIRGLGRQPGFTAMVVVTLALGFGVNAAMFSMLNRLFTHQPDGVVAPGEVRRFYNDFHAPGTALANGRGVQVFDRYEYPHFRAMRRAGVGDALALVTEPDSVNVGGRYGAFSARETEVSSAYFSILGLRPAVGRFFVAEEDSIETPRPVAVISEYLWRTRFGQAPDVLGASVIIDHHPFTIVGVAPPTFRGIDLDAVDVWVPLNTRGYSSNDSRRWYENFGLAARLIARVRSRADEARLVTIVQNAMQTTQIPGYAFDPHETVRSGSLIAGRGPADPAKEASVLTRISAVALFVLIIAVANVVNLLLLRAANRRRELALRRALGISSGRLIWQLVLEGTLLSVIAGVVAMAIAVWAGGLLRHLVMPATHWATSPVDATTASFILCLSLLIGLASGVAPALYGLDVQLADALKSGSASGGSPRSATRTALLIVQVGLCVVLLVGAGLFAKSLSNVMSIDTGYDVADVFVVSPNFPLHTGTHVAEAARVVPELVRRLASNPAIAAASYAQMGPMMGMRYHSVSLPGGEALPPSRNDIGAGLNVVSPTYFDAAGMRILRGRAFTTGDGASAPRVVVVNATMARSAWPNVDPLGKCLIIGDRNMPCTTVVGVVNDANRFALIENHSMIYYVPATQPIDTIFPVLRVIVRARPGQAAHARFIASQEVAHAFSNVDGVDTRTLYSVVERQARPWNIGATLFTAFGVLAFIVAGVGVYSVVAYAVAQRTHELGIRTALGATRANITDLVLADGMRAVGVGVAVGLGASLLLAPLVRALLFGVATNDASTYIAAATALCALGGVASLIPALRAARVDPVVALRAE